MLHLNRISERVADTGMTARNLSIVWAPNLLRTPFSSMSTASSASSSFSSSGMATAAAVTQPSTSSPEAGKAKHNERRVDFDKDKPPTTTTTTTSHLQSHHRNSSIFDSQSHNRLQVNLFQNTQVIQCLIENAKWIFAEDQTDNKNSTVF